MARITRITRTTQIHIHTTIAIRAKMTIITSTPDIAYKKNTKDNRNNNNSPKRTIITITTIVAMINIIAITITTRHRI